jgi:maltooligosyltrehalose trehalohydrolase
MSHVDGEKGAAFGAQLTGDGRACFRLWAPDCGAVWLDRDGAGVQPMQALDGGWFETVAPAQAGARYRYRLGAADGQAVPDIAARAQLGGVHGWSMLVDPARYAWRTTHWRGRPWHEAIIEEVHVGLLDGFDGVRKRLPAYAAAGITAIELMPVAEFPGTRNWGYDGALPFAPDAAYGGPDALKRLIDDAHGLGLMVLLDVVYNHFGPEGNCLPQYASPFFRADRHTPWGPAIDVAHPVVAEFFIANARYWLDEFRCDGLRIDAAHAIVDQAWLQRFAARVRSAGANRHVHLVLEHEGNAAHLLERGFDAQWDDDWHHAMHVLLTGERNAYYRDFAASPLELLARAWREGFAWQGEASPFHAGAPRGEPSAHLPPTKFVNFLQNHDQIGNRAFGERLSTLVAAEPLHAAQAFLLLSPQIPLLFMGDEYGETRPFQYFTAYEAELAAAVRDGRRHEFAAFPEFADANKRTRIPDPSDPGTFAASRPAPPRTPGTVAQRFATLIALRRREIVPWLDRPDKRDTRVLGPKALLACWQRADGRTLFLHLNLDDTACAAPAMRGAALYATSPLAAASLAQGRLAGQSFVACLR